VSSFLTAHQHNCYQKCKRVTDEHAQQSEAGAAALLDAGSADTNDSAGKTFQFIVDHTDKAVFSAKHVVSLTDISMLCVSTLLEYGHSLSDSNK